MIYILLSDSYYPKCRKANCPYLSSYGHLLSRYSNLVLFALRFVQNSAINMVIEVQNLSLKIMWKRLNKTIKVQLIIKLNS